MQKRVFEVFRELDFVVVAVHELAGHHLHESNILQAGDRSYFMSDRNDTQEGCAMDCEKRLLTGPLCHGARVEALPPFESARGQRDNLCVGPVSRGPSHASRVRTSLCRKVAEERSTTCSCQRMSTVVAKGIDYYVVLCAQKT